MRPALRLAQIITLAPMHEAESRAFAAQQMGQVAGSESEPGPELEEVEADEAELLD